MGGGGGGACVARIVYYFLIVPGGKFGSPYLVRHNSRKSSATHSYESVEYFVCPNNGMAASVWDLLNVRADVDACDCTWGLYEHCKRVCTES